MTRPTWLAWVALPLMACGGGEPPQEEKPMTDSAYVAEVEQWRAQRMAGLREPDGWLSLVGLHWLEEGFATVGSDPASDLLLPAGKAAERLGTLHRAGRRVRFEAAPDAVVTLEGEPVGAAEMASDISGEQTTLAHGSLIFYVIERGERVGIRVKDLESERLRDFTGVDHYPVDAAWRLTARFEPFDQPKMIPVPNITGDIIEQPSHGRVVFAIDGVEHSLEPLGEVDTPLFLVFGDQTNGGETYGGGRFLYAAPPDAEGRMVVDFNKAYNPPCVFTAYATCPLPPPGNRLPLRLTAGEKNFGAVH
jgi:uncharacterized protein (DUF1684 family)